MLVVAFSALLHLQLCDGLLLLNPSPLWLNLHKLHLLELGLQTVTVNNVDQTQVYPWRFLLSYAESSFRNQPQINLHYTIFTVQK